MIPFLWENPFLLAVRRGLPVEARSTDPAAPLAVEGSVPLAGDPPAKRRRAGDVGLGPAKAHPRDDALRGWLRVVRAMKGAPAEAQVSALGDADAIEVVPDIFAMKGTATIKKRLKAIQFHEAGDENKVYEYVKYLERTQAAPTRAQSFLEATNFFLARQDWSQRRLRGCVVTSPNSWLPRQGLPRGRPPRSNR